MRNVFSHKYMEEFEEAEIIGETTYKRSNLGNPDNDSVWNWLARQADRLTEGNKSSILTEGIILAGLSKSETELRLAQQQNKQGLEKFLSQVDTEELIKIIAGESKPVIRNTSVDYVKNNVPGFIIGGVVGITALAILRRRKR